MRNEKGITLIALVVTIVVLLILAGITITYALSDNGIFNSAKKAEEATVKATLVDAVGNAQAECLIRSYDTSDPVPTTADELVKLVKYYIPEAWSLTSTDLAFTDKALAGTITVTKGTDTYTVTVAKGIVTGCTKQ